VFLLVTLLLSRGCLPRYSHTFLAGAGRSEKCAAVCCAVLCWGSWNSLMNRLKRLVTFRVFWRSLRLPCFLHSQTSHQFCSPTESDVVHGGKKVDGRSCCCEGREIAAGYKARKKICKSTSKQQRKRSHPYHPSRILRWSSVNGILHPQKVARLLSISPTRRMTTLRPSKRRRTASSTSTHAYSSRTRSMHPAA
jgi:hypothetical protein